MWTNSLRQCTLADVHSCCCCSSNWFVRTLLYFLVCHYLYLPCQQIGCSQLMVRLSCSLLCSVGFSENNHVLCKYTHTQFSYFFVYLPSHFYVSALVGTVVVRRQLDGGTLIRQMKLSTAEIISTGSSWADVVATATGQCFINLATSPNCSLGSKGTITIP